MSRLGDLLHTERLRRNMTLKQVAKLGGVSEGYLKDVEAGTRIIQDDQARRILKKMGLTEQHETGFSLEDIAATVDLGTAAPKAAPVKKPRETEKVYSSKDEDEKNVAGSVWLDALSSVLKRVPVYNAVMKEVDHRLLPILDGKIEGASPDKVFFFAAPDDSMRGFRIMRDDYCFVAPCQSPVDGAIMLVEKDGRRALRKIKKLDALNVLLQSYDRDYAGDVCSLQEISILGRVLKVEFTLS